MLLKHFEKTGKRFQCRFCPKVFVRKFTVVTHEKVLPVKLILIRLTDYFFQSHPEYVPRLQSEKQEPEYEEDNIGEGDCEEEHLEESTEDY